VPLRAILGCAHLAWPSTSAPQRRSPDDRL